MCLFVDVALRAASVVGNYDFSFCGRCFADDLDLRKSLYSAMFLSHVSKLLYFLGFEHQEDTSLSHLEKIVECTSQRVKSWSGAIDFDEFSFIVHVQKCLCSKSFSRADFWSKGIYLDTAPWGHELVLATSMLVCS